MTDKDILISDLNDISEILINNGYGGWYATIRKAVDMLKEQEAELSYREAKTITHTATKLDDATCPSCGNVIRERYDYCHYCGQKLDWEDR
jgi:hypothetical protein